MYEAEGTVLGLLRGDVDRVLVYVTRGTGLGSGRVDGVVRACTCVYVAEVKGSGLVRFEGVRVCTWPQAAG